MLRRGLPGSAGQSFKQGGRSGAFIGIDTSKLRNAVAVAEEGRSGEVRYLGEIDTTEACIEQGERPIAGVPLRRPIVLGVNEQTDAASFTGDADTTGGGAQEQRPAEPASAGRRGGDHLLRREAGIQAI